MKLKFFYNLIFLGLLAFVLQSRSGGVGAVMNQDRTGSPISQGGGTYCASCHSGSNFNPSISIKLFDNGDEISEYAPGGNYQLEVSINAGSGNPDGYGMQSVVLDGANNGAGTFGNAAAGTRLTSLGGIDYFEHSSISSSNKFMIDWVAPESGTGDISIYAGGVAVNGNGGTSGDGAAKASITIPEAATTSLAVLNDDSFQASIYPNPVYDLLQLNLDAPVSGLMHMHILNLTGKVINARSESVNSGKNLIMWNLSNLESGLYFLSLRNSSGEMQSLKLLKR